MLVVTGSIGIDYILNFPGNFSERIMPDKIHKISLSFLVDTLKKQYGGTAGNIAYSLGLFEMKPVLYATAGVEFFEYDTILKKAGVDTKRVKKIPKKSCGSYFVINDTNHNQIGAFYTGAMADAKNLSLTKLFKKKSNTTSDIVIIAPNDPLAMKQYVDECIALDLPYMYDPAFQIGNFSKKELVHAITHARILIANDYEMELLQEKSGMSFDEITQKVSIVITTLGGKGATIHTQGSKITIQAALLKKVVDPTGAGDAFRAGFVAGYMRGLDLKTCGQMGSVAALYTLEKYGTTTHTFSKKQFEARYKKSYDVRLILS